MGPSKRKGSVRRPVLDLNTKESSPSRLTWQTKYQQVLPNEEIQENGDASSQSNNPLSSLLGNYNSDSDSEETVTKPSTALDAKVEDFLKEIHSISVETKNNAQKAPTDAPKPPNIKQTEEEKPSYPSSVTAWQQCYDHNSGYPYYWNTETNEVTWEMPVELKAALTSIAIKQQQEQQQNQKSELQQKITKQPQPPDEVKKKVIRYPWQTESDSEDEKIEMITSFGPQSDEESDGEIKKTKQKKSDKTQKPNTLVGPQFPSGPTGPCMDPSKIKSDSVSFPSEDSEGLNEPSYETSSLLTHCIQDTGPPGDDTFLANKTSTTKKKTSTYLPKKDSSLVPSATNKANGSLKISDTLPPENPSREDPPDIEKIEKQSTLKHDDKTPIDVTEDIIAQIEKETPPDYQVDSNLGKTSPDSLALNSDISSQTNSKSAGIALIANYDDDSESEESSTSDRKQHTVNEPQLVKKSIFPIEIPQERKEEVSLVKPLFPCLDAEPVKITEYPRQKDAGAVDDTQETAANIYNADVDVSEATSHKAFKRKKRLEFATTVYGPSTSKLSEVKSSSPERPSPVGVSTTQYNMDPSMNERRGFGFSSLRCEADSERKTYKNYGGIKFIKAETMNPTIAPVPESNEKAENETETASAPRTSAKEPELGEEIEDAASLLREKVTFLTGGKTHIPPIQYMAIELETLVLAWQQGALTPPYLLRWLNEKCAELISHEKSAAPTGWTCLWDRKNKRYYYRNSVTKAIQWDYPTAEEKAKGKEGDVVGGGDEMDICDTPPHMSPVESEKHPETQSSTPPPALSDAPTNALPRSPTIHAPLHCPEIETLVPKTSKKRKRKLECKNKEGDGDVTVSKNSIITSYVQGTEFSDVAPPLPPLPPPPPPPPDESPPPLPDSPPPLPLDPDQPLPPGVDEPEYTLYRRTSPKHSYKKAQNESSAYSAELMMSYGYGYSSNGQPITMQMQPLEYHTYMHETVANPYLVQSAPTSHVIQCSAKKPKVSLNSELMSFYSDLALLDATSNDNSNQDSQSTSATPVTSQERTTATTTAAAVAATTTTTPVVSVMTTSASTTISAGVATTTSKAPDTVTSNGLNVKKKKKVKSTTGLSLKKKGVSSLVAKWQQVQQEVRKDFSDDDDDSGAVR